MDRDRKLIPMPILRKDKQIEALERIILRSLEAYYRIATPQRATFLLNNITAAARRKGTLLPADRPASRPAFRPSTMDPSDYGKD